MSSLPYTCSSMAAAFGDSEQHELMVCRRINRGILWPIVSQIMNQYSILLIDHGLPRGSIGVVW